MFFIDPWQSKPIEIRFRLLLLLFHNKFAKPPISSEMIDRFWHSRCLNNRINLFYMIGSFASGANVSMVAKNWTKKIIPLLWIKSSKKPQIKKFQKTDPPQKWEFGFKIQFQNFQKPKVKLKKDPLKFQKIKNIYKEASNQKVL